MANNGGRQGGGGGNGQMNEHVEFTVKVSFRRAVADTEKRMRSILGPTVCGDIAFVRKQPTFVSP